MTFAQRLKTESRPTLALAFPLITGQVSHMLTNLTDTIMIGRLGVAPLAAATLANMVLLLPMMFAIGMALAVSIQVSQARGAMRPAVARSAMRHGLYLCVGIAIITVALSALSIPLLSYLHQPAEVVAMAPDYFMLIAVSFIPAMGGMVIKNHADAMNRPWPPLFILLGGVLLNVFFNWLFIYGNWGMPAWGLEGAGVATVLARVLTVIGLLIWCRQDARLREWAPTRWFAKIDWQELRAMWSLGWPTSFQILSQISAFVTASLFIGSIGADAMAAHQIALTCTATIFMVPVGLSQALTVRVGAAFGARVYEVMRPILVGGWVMGGLFTLCSSICFLLLNQQIASVFIEQGETLMLAASLLQIAAVFQFGDAMQVTSVGALRGLGQVRLPAWIAFLSSWFISIPCGWLLAFELDMGVRGIWWGFTASLTTQAFALGWLAWKKTKTSSLPRDPLWDEVRAAG